MLRARDLAQSGFSPTHLQRLYEQGLLVRSGRGVYLPADAELDANGTLAEVALRVPAGVVCLLSALQFYNLTTQLPHQVWIALSPRAHSPRLDYPPVRVIRLSGKALTEGIQTHEIGGVLARVYNPAKTVADCFKYRNKIGLDVALAVCRRGKCDLFSPPENHAFLMPLSGSASLPIRQRAECLFNRSSDWLLTRVLRHKTGV